MSNESKECATCATIYIGDGYKGACTKECFTHAEYRKARGLAPRDKKKEVFDKTCLKCQEPFKTNRAKGKYCSYGCARASTRPNAQEKIMVANAKWLARTESPMKRRGFSMAKLNKQAEWRRVWDDDSWTRHYQSVRG